jgi:hypothetical protein
MSAFGPNPGAVDSAQPMNDWIVAAPQADLAPELMKAEGKAAVRQRIKDRTGL